MLKLLIAVFLVVFIPSALVWLARTFLPLEVAEALFGLFGGIAAAVPLVAWLVYCWCVRQEPRHGSE